MLPIVWLGTAVTFVAAAIALIVAALAKRPANVDELGAVSKQWIAEHSSNQ